MKKYLLLLREDIQQMKNLSPKEMEDLTNAHMAWAEKLAKKEYLISGDGLEQIGVQITGPECIVKDGTFLESTEMIGGFYLIQATNLDAAVAIAKECPCHLWGGTTEVRPIMDYEG